MTNKWAGRSSERGPGLVLGLLLGGTGQTKKKGRDGPTDNLLDIDAYVEQAQQAERGKIHTVFLADALVTSDTERVGNRGAGASNLRPCLWRQHHDTGPVYRNRECRLRWRP